MRQFFLRRALEAMKQLLLVRRWATCLFLLAATTVATDGRKNEPPRSLCQLACLTPLQGVTGGRNTRVFITRLFKTKLVQLGLNPLIQKEMAFNQLVRVSSRIAAPTPLAYCVVIFYDL